MKRSRLSLFLFLGAAIALTACRFNGEVFRSHLPTEVSGAPSIYNERGLVFCAVSIYSLPDSIQRMDTPLSTPDHATSDWMQLPLEEKVDYGSLVAQALESGDACFDKEAQRITGFAELSEYFSTNRPGYFIQVESDLILVHDITRSLVIVSANAR